MILWAGVVLLAAVVVGDQAYRRVQRQRTRRQSRSARRSLGWQAERAAQAVGGPAAGDRGPGVEWDPELVAIMEAKLSELDGRAASLAAVVDTDRTVVAEASSLSADYGQLEQLARRLHLAEVARGWPHPKVDQLVEARDLAGVVADDRPDPPAPRHVSRLANDLGRLEAAREELLASLVAVPPTGSPDVLATIDDLVDGYERLSVATDRAWARMFPTRAASEEAAGKAAMDDYETARRLARELDERVERRDQEAERREAGRRGRTRHGDDHWTHWFD